MKKETGLKPEEEGSPTQQLLYSIERARTTANFRGNIVDHLIDLLIICKDTIESLEEESLKLRKELFDERKKKRVKNKKVQINAKNSTQNFYIK